MASKVVPPLLWTFLVASVFGSLLPVCLGLELLSLNGEEWMVTQVGGNITVKAQVPGSVYTDLISSNILGDPYYRFNDIEYRWVSLSDWRYSRSFEVSQQLLNLKHVDMVFEGLDTVATVTVNDVVILHSDNMFRRYVVDVTNVVKLGVNSISILFLSPVTFARSQADKYPYPVPPDCPPPAQKGECYFNFIRKEACSFSWDWGPAFPTMGIWKNISLEAYDSATVEYLTVETLHIGGSEWTLLLDVYFNVVSPVDGQIELNVDELEFSSVSTVSLATVDKSAVAHVYANVTKVKPWWPSGYGEPKLYVVAVKFTSVAGDVMERKFNVGFRTVELFQDPVQDIHSGNTFYFRINGRAIFAKGSNWIPADIFQERITASYLELLLGSAVEVNMNMLRVWGGGVYESEEFYELADRLGIMIWQDFMFACALYPVNEEFLSNVREEVTHQVRRLKRHPSVVVWAGNNENEGALASNWWKISDHDMPRYREDYVKLYIDTIRPIVLKEDTSRPFLPSSPSNGVNTEAEGWIAKDPQSPLFGDTHDYNYNRNSWNSSEYAIPRFGSEFGLQSWCSAETLMPVSNPVVDWDMASRFPDHRQHHTNGENEMLAELLMNMKASASANKTRRFEDFIYLTQINQAVGIKTEVELYQRMQSHVENGYGYTMGALYWQLNDIWQAPTWASIEYGGKWKLLHYFAKRFFNKTALSAFIDSDRNINLYYIDDTIVAPYTVLSSQNTLQFEPDLQMEDEVDGDAQGKLRWSQDGKIAKMSSLSDEAEQYSHKADAVTVLAQCFQLKSFTPTVIQNITFAKPQVAAKLVYSVPVSSMLADCRCSRPADCFIYFTDITTSEADAYVFLGKLSEVDALPSARVQVDSVKLINAQTAEISLKSSDIALFVLLEAEQFHGWFSDNGFLMTESIKVVQFRSWKQPINLESLRERLTVRSLSDIYK